jgi:hypothetical protein
VADLLAVAFLCFRLVFIPAFTLSHSEHGNLWLTVLVGLLLTFGGEWLARRKENRLSTLHQNLAAVILALILVGLLPEEGPVGLILWLGIGLAWGEYRRNRPSLPRTQVAWLGAGAGAILGLSGLVGPGSWLMALLLLPLFWMDGGKD